MKITPIRENHLFQKAYRNGSRAVTPTVSVYVLRDYKAQRIRLARPDKRLINRLGITATKKIGGAVQRVRAKRVIREAYRLIEAETPLVPGNLIVIAARERATSVPMQDVRADLTRAFQKLGLIPHES